MRKLLKTLFAGTVMAMLVAWPVMAVTIEEGGIIAGCFTDGDDTVISGSVTVSSGDDDFVLTLMGHMPGGSDFEPIPGVSTFLVVNNGPGTYPFTFNVTGIDLSVYNSLRVDSTSANANPEKSDSFPPDCDTPIDEAPFAILLLVTGGLVALWFASRQMKAPAHPTAA